MPDVHSSVRHLVLVFALAAQLANGERISDVANTPHNLSAAGSGAVTASTEDEICVFCHTPHGAATFPGSPLWNRQLSGETYTLYTSASLDAAAIMGSLDQPGGSSKLCLSCHDGTLAIGSVNVLGGQQNVDITMTGVDPDGSMPPGSGALTGFTRDLGIDLSNDHPVAFNYDSALAAADGELLDPAAASHIGVRSPSVRPAVPLEPTGAGAQAQVQCATCHDPHIRDTDLTVSAKFLRHERLQQTSPIGGTFDQDADILCLACHDKLGWSISAHATAGTADETYLDAAAIDRDFPLGTTVWQASCLNCHDTHTVQGARRLLREATDSPMVPRSGGSSAIEETCYDCHNATPIVANASGDVKDIATDFALPRRMPIASIDQPAGTEIHEVTDADLTETRTSLGSLDSTNRHAECTDCHNPHRVVSNTLFNAAGSNSPTHAHAAGHDNVASGALRGIWGVEPAYGSSSFPSLPVTYVVKDGDGGVGASTDATSTWVTREYQVCLKCHSDYGYPDDNVYPTGSRPDLGESGGGTPSGTNGLTQFTNQAMEFHAPLLHKGEVTTTDSGAGANYAVDNHRSWHPVVDDTGRDNATRQSSAAAWLAPWDTGVGNQTMYCTDCHGTDTAPTTVVPSGNGAWGPHGSTNDFILKGSWDDQTGGQTRDVPTTDPNNGLCFKCHDFQTYADRNGDDADSGFSGPDSNNLHALHADRIEQSHCSWCHVAVPHGWKNKALLVNLNDTGAEAGVGAETEVAIGSDADVYDQQPYYRNAKLKIITFAPSGQWEESNCGSAGSTVAGNDTQSGRDWMRDVCSNPP